MLENKKLEQLKALQDSLLQYCQQHPYVAIAGALAVLCGGVSFVPAASAYALWWQVGAAGFAVSSVAGGVSGQANDEIKRLERQVTEQSRSLENQAQQMIELRNEIVSHAQQQSQVAEHLRQVESQLPAISELRQRVDGQANNVQAQYQKLAVEIEAIKQKSITQLQSYEPDSVQVKNTTNKVAVHSPTILQRVLSFNSATNYLEEANSLMAQIAEVEPLAQQLAESKEKSQGGKPVSAEMITLLKKVSEHRLNSKKSVDQPYIHLYQLVVGVLALQNLTDSTSPFNEKLVAFECDDFYEEIKEIVQPVIDQTKYVTCDSKPAKAQRSTLFKQEKATQSTGHLQQIRQGVVLRAVGERLLPEVSSRPPQPTTMFELLQKCMEERRRVIKTEDRQESDSESDHEWAAPSF